LDRFIKKICAWVVPPLLSAVAILPGVIARAHTETPAILSNVGLDQKLNDQVPLDLSFRDENGNAVRLAQYFGKMPVILTLSYYQCPMLCTQVLNATARGLQGTSLEIGKDFTILTVSINPRETPRDAEAKKRIYASVYPHPGVADGWHFLTGDEPAIEALAHAVGFRYAYDPESGEYAHPSGMMVLTPEGRLSRYFYGVQYPSRDLRLSLVEASSNKIGSPVDQILLYCFHYDPATGKYGIVILNVVRAAGLATVILIGGYITMMLRSERAARRHEV
jgi:protein SCO1